MITKYASIFSGLIILTFIWHGCHPLYCNWDSGYKQLEKAPEKDKTVGLYKLNGISIIYLLKEGYQVDSCRLVLKGDGEYEITAPDNIFNALGISNGKVLSRKGRWFVSCDNPGCLIELEGICVVPFTKKNELFAVPIEIGDGDECRGIVFKK